MIETMELTNEEIYSKAIDFTSKFSFEEINLPVKVGFYLNKNIATIVNSGQEIEMERAKLVDKYAVLDDETGQYSFKEGKEQIFNKEVRDLFSLTQEIDIYKIDLDLFEGVNLSPGQINAITFMIEEE